MAAPTYDAVSSGGATATSVTVAHTCTGSNRVLYVATLNRNAGSGTVTDVTYNGVAMTRIQTTVALGSSDIQVWRLIAPASGANNIVASLSGSRQTIVVGVSYADADQTTPEGTSAMNAGLLTVNVTGSADTNILSFPFVENSAAPAPPQYAATGTAQTERADAGQAAEFLGASTQTGTGTVTASWTYAGSTTGGEERNVYAVPVNGITAPAGPTVTVQPTAQTARVNGESAATATFTGTATGTGTVDATTEIEDGVASGVYGTLANGSGATWSGLTGTGSGSATATPVGTFTAETLNGRRIRIKFDDDNGTTYSNAVALTVYTGPVLSTYSGIGVGTIDLSADEVLGTGYSYRVTVTPTGYASAAKRSHGRAT